MLSKFATITFKSAKNAKNGFRIAKSYPKSAFNNLHKCFSLNIEPEGDRLRKQEVLKVRNEAKKLLNEQKQEMEEAHEQGLMTVQEI